MKRENVKLYPGILADCFAKVRENFYERIDEKKHARVYVGLYPEGYAEPEFTGKFLDLCAYYYESEGDSRAKEKGMAVVASIAENIREDGYLGCHERGKECVSFSFWDHVFTLYGLTRMYEATEDEGILALVRRAADFIYSTYENPADPDILAASNKGSQNISCLFPMGRAYLVTGDKRYLDFVGRVLEYCEGTDMKLLSFESIFDLRSQKGIEMLIVYLGVLQYGLLTGDKRAKEAAERYFNEIRATQIRNTGNGTIRESWTEGGNAARLMPTESKPNETCVAVGWIELALSLFHASPSPVYLDAIERTLFNHMVGSLEKKGSDLAYYQGNYGQKIYRTDDGAYQCCRYRGFTLFSYLKEFLFAKIDNCIYPLIYAPCEYRTESLMVKCETAYPTDGVIHYTVENAGDEMTMKLRIPAWCNSYTLEGAKGVRAEGGFLAVALPKGKTSFALRLAMQTNLMRHEIDGAPYFSVEYGSLLLARDTRFGEEMMGEADPELPILRAEDTPDAHIHFRMGEGHLVDFASAGGHDPANDRYTVFIPIKNN